MDDNERYNKAIADIIAKDPRYHVEAYDFINKAVTFTIRKLQRGNRPPGNRHVTGAELVNGVIEFAGKEFGILAGMVLDDWNIRNGKDIGNLVFNMIAGGILTASREDRIEDFDCIRDIPAILNTLPETISPENEEIPKIS